MAEQLSEQQQRESMEMERFEIIEKNTEETVDDGEVEESDGNDGLIISEQEEGENSEKENQNHQELLLLQDITEDANKKIDDEDEIGSPKEGNNDDKFVL
jgi:hypothetical protein